VRGKFNCGDGWTTTTLWEDMEEYVFPALGTGCLEGLTPSAKQLVLDRWNAWKFKKFGGGHAK
jgi:hypothetical protein